MADEHITFEETGEERKVTRMCEVCYKFAGRYLDYTSMDIVSPGGVGHFAAEDNEGYTHCGKDATGDNWWWRY